MAFTKPSQRLASSCKTGKFSMLVNWLADPLNTLVEWINHDNAHWVIVDLKWLEVIRGD
ncbi:hypothetical protein DPMN_004525 [Dreissena polymorpha]|uniref:Uncharacterized protein n=1 Tax=Dreissena polymorpha TaxID=45954 RepID=A0A9D4RT26_DREPO|nr:hypothetical protein DPMN_004525 [Dreissena polymorpha]